MLRLLKLYARLMRKLRRTESERGVNLMEREIPVEDVLNNNIIGILTYFDGFRYGRYPFVALTKEDVVHHTQQILAFMLYGVTDVKLRPYPGGSSMPCVPLPENPENGEQMMIKW